MRLNDGDEVVSLALVEKGEEVEEDDSEAPKQTELASETKEEPAKDSSSK